MLSFTTAFVVAAVAAGVFGAPTTDDPAQLAKRSSPNSSGTNNGFYYQFCRETRTITAQSNRLTEHTGTDGGGGSATYTNGAAGEYAVNWQGISDFTAGKGWQQAEPRNISFTGTFSASGNYYLSIYTWSGQGENYVSLYRSVTCAESMADMAARSSRTTGKLTVQHITQWQSECSQVVFAVITTLALKPRAKPVH